MNFKNIKSQVGFEPLPVLLEITRLDNGANNELAQKHQNDSYL